MTPQVKAPCEPPPCSARLTRFTPGFTTTTNGSHEGKDVFLPYKRDERLARPWALPGTPGLEHRIGGLEKQDITGNVSYDPANHQHMINTRAKKVANIANELPPQKIDGPATGDLLVVSLGRLEK